MSLILAASFWYSFPWVLPRRLKLKDICVRHALSLRVRARREDAQADACGLALKPLTELTELML